MTMNSSQTSAQIIPFPKGGRASVSKSFDSGKLSEPVPVTEVLSGSWYHDEAIQEALAANWSQKH
jgi:hypothetical protein